MLTLAPTSWHKSLQILRRPLDVRPDLLVDCSIEGYIGGLRRRASGQTAEELALRQRMSV